MMHKLNNKIAISLLIILLLTLPLSTIAGAGNQPPCVPSYPNPSYSATQVNTTLTLTWQGGDPNSEDTIVYDVYFGTSYPPPKVSAKQHNTTYPVDNLRDNTLYYWLIVSRDNQGGAAAGPLWRFTTKPVPNNPPHKPHTPTPQHEDNNIATPTQLRWECDDPDQEKIFYDIFLEANDTTPDLPFATNYPYTDLSTGTLTYNTTYYWQVVASDIHGATNKSAIWQFTTGGKNANHPPDQPIEPTPDDQSSGISLSTSLSWSCTDQDNDTLTYTVNLGTTTTPAIVAENQTQSTYTPSSLSYNTTYYWQVEVYDKHNAHTSGPLWSFNTEEQGANHPPNTPYSPTPTNGKTNVYINPTLMWKCSDDEDDNIEYDVFLGTLSTSMNKKADDIQTIQYTLSNLAYDTTYYWRVDAIDSNNAKTEGDTWSFRTVSSGSNNPPNIPSSPSPNNGKTGVATNGKLQWAGRDPDSGDTISYTIYFGTNQQPPKIIDNITDPEYRPGKLSFDTSYYWKVTSTDNHGLSSTSPIWTFTTKEGNEHPLADAGGPYQGFVDERITFDGSGSADPDGEIVSYRWNFGDNSFGTAEIAHHTFTSEGSYQVTLTVVDDDGQEATDSTTITIKQANFAPMEPTVDGPTSGNAGEPLTYTISAQDKDGDLIQFFITWGDGTTTTSNLVLSSTEEEHTWSNQGLYTLKVTAEDENGGRSTTEELKISIGVKILELNFPLHFLFGYLIDYDNDGVYDVFQRIDKREMPVLFIKDEQYLIDDNDDGEWDYRYDPYAKTLDKATAEDINQTETNAGFFVFSEDFIIFLPILIVGGLIIGVEVAIVSYTRRKKKMH